MPTVLLCVDGLDSPDDEERIREALLAERGVFGAVASHTDGCVEVDVEDDTVTVARLVEILEREGFSARLGG
jgi:acylphosphatase